MAPRPCIDCMAVIRAGKRCRECAAKWLSQAHRDYVERHREEIRARQQKKYASAPARKFCFECFSDHGDERKARRILRMMLPEDVGYVLDCYPCFFAHGRLAAWARHFRLVRSGCDLYWPEQTTIPQGNLRVSAPSFAELAESAVSMRRFVP